MFFSIILNFISSIICLNVGIGAFFKRKMYFIGVFALAYSLLFCLVPFFDNIFIGPGMYHPEAVEGIIADIKIYNYYAIINLLYSLSIYIWYIIIVHKKVVKNNVPEVIIPYNYKHMTGYIFLAGVVLYIYSTGFSANSFTSLIITILDAGRMAAFQNDNFNSLFLNISFYLMSVISYYAFVRQKNISFLFNLIVYGSLTLVTILMGGRQFIILAFSGYFISYFFSSNYSKLKVLIVSFFIFFFLIIWQLIRARLYAGSMVINQEDIKNVLLTGDFSYFYYSSLEAIRKYLYHDWMFFGNIYRNLFFMFFPHDWTFGLKQQDLSVYFAEAFWSSAQLVRTGNYPPGLIGLFVLNFGFWGWLLIGWPFLFFLYILEFLKRNSIVFIAFGAVFIQLVLQFSRGTLMGFYQSAFLLILLFMYRTIDYNIKKYL